MYAKDNNYDFVCRLYELFYNQYLTWEKNRRGTQ